MTEPNNTGEKPNQFIPNLTLSRTARVGGKTEDELLLEHPKQARPVPRVPDQAEFTRGDPWRVLRILGEFVQAFDALAEVGAAITVFGSARTPEGDPMYEAARDLASKLCQAGFAPGYSSWSRKEEVMSATITVEEAQARLKELIHQMAPGEEVVITENQQPIAKLVSEQPKPQPKQRPGPGLGKGMITFIAPDFDAPLENMKQYME